MLRWQGRVTAALVLAAAVAAVPAVGPAGPPPFAPVPASADHMDADLPWPQVLPAQPAGTEVQPGPQPGCRKPHIRCVEGVVRDMTRRWRPLDRACDHRAVFALTYLRTTEGFLETLRADPDYFDDFDYVVWEDVLFFLFYARAYDAWERGEGFVPEAWRIAFEAGAEGDANAGQDVLLGMNAHIQRDLPYVLAELGLREPDGSSRKPDHDRVNAILTRVLDPIQDELAERYDPFIATSDLKPAPLDELGALELLKSWREGAWRNAERLAGARTEEQRQQVGQSIEQYSRLWAESLVAGEQPGYREQRDAYCTERDR